MSEKPPVPEDRPVSERALNLFASTATIKNVPQASRAIVARLRLRSPRATAHRQRTHIECCRMRQHEVFRNQTIISCKTCDQEQRAAAEKCFC